MTTTERIDLRLAPVALCAWVACALAVDAPPGRALLAAAALGLLALGLAVLPVRSVPSALRARAARGARHVLCGSGGNGVASRGGSGRAVG